LTYGLHDFVGNIGVLLVLLAYLLLQVEKLSLNSLMYSLLNLVGSLLIMVSLFFNFNLSSFIIEVAWLLISIYGLVRLMRRGTRPA
jgi:hypothetical protein